MSDIILFNTILKELFTAVVGDVLDKLGYFHKFLSQRLKPIHPVMVLVGRAMPVLEADVFAEKNRRYCQSFDGHTFLS